MIGFGIAAITVVQAVTLGMEENVTEGAARYLGGRYIVVARSWNMDHENFIEDSSKVAAALASVGIQPRLTVSRENVTNSDQTLFFNGDSFKLRRIAGVDFRAERDVFSSLAFISGGFAEMYGTNGLLISVQVAERFAVRVGDGMTLRLKNRQGYIDSVELVVRGIFKDASIFGYYTCYVDRELLRKLVGDPEGSSSAMGFYFDGKEKPMAQAAELQRGLSLAGFELFPRLFDHNDLLALGGSSWIGTRYAVLPVEYYIDAKVMDLIHAIQTVSYLLLGMILLIILVGMRNTTQIMTRRRTTEIGTIRALGMTKGGSLRLVIGEAVLVASLGFLIGVAVTVVLLIGLQVIPFNWSDGFDIFLRRGHLTWKISLVFLSANYIALIVMTVAGALPAGRRAARISPVAAIAMQE
jgi:putative ABC transport system permease protein